MTLHEQCMVTSIKNSVINVHDKIIETLIICLGFNRLFTFIHG